MKRRTSDDWARLVEGWKTSGLTAAAFGERRGVNPRTLVYWNWRLGKERGDVRKRPGRRRRAASPSFTELALGPSPAVVEVVIGDATVRVPKGADASLVREVVRALRGAE